MPGDGKAGSITGGCQSLQSAANSFQSRFASCLPAPWEHFSVVQRRSRRKRLRPVIPFRTGLALNSKKAQKNRTSWHVKRKCVQKLRAIFTPNFGSESAGVVSRNFLVRSLIIAVTISLCVTSPAHWFHAPSRRCRSHGRLNAHHLTSPLGWHSLLKCSPVAIPMSLPTVQ